MSAVKLSLEYCDIQISDTLNFHMHSIIFEISHITKIYEVAGVLAMKNTYVREVHNIIFELHLQTNIYNIQCNVIYT